jgi:hypothetical protein
MHHSGEIEGILNMPRKLSDARKKKAGTYRADREAAPLTPTEAQVAVTAAALVLERAKKRANKRTLTPRQKKLAQEKVRVMGDNLEIALEISAKALKAAAEVPAPVRPGLELMSDWEADHADPPLRVDERYAYEFIVIGGRDCPQSGSSHHYNEVRQNALNAVRRAD